MAHDTAEIGRSIDSMRDALGDAVVDRHYELHPELAARFGPRGRQKCREDAGYHLRHLAQSLAASEPALFHEYVAWAKVMLAGRGIAVSDLADNLRITTDVLKALLPAHDATLASEYVSAAIADLPQMAAPPSFIHPDQPLTGLASAYLATLLACERHNASKLILDAVKSGTSIKDIYIQVFQESQQEIGRLWQMNRITVAQEHYCTAATQMIMSQLYPQIFAGPRIGRCFVGACVSSDLHEIGMRMVTDFFEMDGWDTVYLGASIPGPDLIRTLQDRKPDVVGISATITPHISAVAQMISDIRAAPGCGGIKILVGGYPFHIAPDLWKQINADGTCQSAQGAVDLASQLLLKREVA